MTPAARFCAACGAPAEAEQTRYASDFASEETRVAAPRPRAVQPLPVEPLAPLAPPHAPARQGAAHDSEEKVVFVVKPTLLFVKIGYVLAALGGVALIALLTWLPGFHVPFLVSFALAFALLLWPAYKHLMRNSVRYTLTDSKIEMDSGFVSRTTRNIPLRNIQDVTVTTSIPQRLLRFGDLVIDNASETGGTTVLHTIPDPRRHADLLLRELRRWH